MRRTTFAIAVFFGLLFILPGELAAQVDPKLTIYDNQGTPYWNLDNSTVFTAAPGVTFKMEMMGAPSAPYGLFMSLKSTPFPTNIVPPPLFIMPPIWSVIAGPDKILNPSGIVTFTGVVPTAFSGLGYDVDLYFQGFVQDPVNGFELTNGIRMVIISAKYKADLAVAAGTALDMIDIFGQIKDPDASDNQVSGSGLLNGEDIVIDPDINPGMYGFKDGNPPPQGTPEPANSIYLNGIFPLVPGDAGFDGRFFIYPKCGSHLYIHTRDRICRNNENKNLQHIIVPVLDSQGQKVNDLNVYHFRDASTNEFGFMAVDVLNNDFYELKGTRLKSNNIMTSESPWDAHVSISPDGKFMAAVQKDRVGDYVNVVENLYIIKLQKSDTWSTGDHARKVKLNDPTELNFKETRVFAETLSFVHQQSGTGYPYVLFFATNKYNTLSGNPMNDQPPIETASVLWSLNPNAEGGAGTFFKYNDDTFFPKTGGNTYFINYYGTPANYVDGWDDLNELVWLVSEDYNTLCIRCAGRFSEWDNTNKVWNLGEWQWDVLAITDVMGNKNFTLTNITNFKETDPQQGWYIRPFGQAYNGQAKAAISPAGTYVAVVGKEHKIDDDTEDLFFVPTDGSKAGAIQGQPVTAETVFKGEFLSERGIFDPFFVGEDEIIFFCGQDQKPPVPYIPAKTDLFLYRDTFGDLRNLTTTASLKEPEPEFTKLGNIRPAGVFLSRDGRYLFFFRGYYDTTGPTQMLNLVGIDLLNGFTVFDLTGKEFSNGFIPDLGLRTDGYYYWGPETMNLTLVPTASSDLLFFTGKYLQYNIYDSFQVFMLNMNYPLAAFPVTSFNPTSQKGIIDNLAADPTGNFIAFSRSNDTGGIVGDTEKIFVVDLAHGAYTRDLTYKYPGYDRASIDGSFRFLASPAPDTAPVLIYGMGAGGADTEADNPSKARLWLFPLDNVSNPAVEAVSYPLTVQKQFLLFNALPNDG